MKLTLRFPKEEKGGPGSGNFGHSGRPGKVGGSAGGAGSSNIEGIAPASMTGQEFESAINDVRMSLYDELNSPKGSNRFEARLSRYGYDTVDSIRNIKNPYDIVNILPESIQSKANVLLYEGTIIERRGRANRLANEIADMVSMDLGWGDEDDEDDDWD